MSLKRNLAKILYSVNKSEYFQLKFKCFGHPTAFNSFINRYSSSGNTSFSVHNTPEEHVPHGHFEKLQVMRKRAKGVACTNKIGFVCKAEHVGECYGITSSFLGEKGGEVGDKSQCMANLGATAQRSPVWAGTAGTKSSRSWVLCVRSEGLAQFSGSQRLWRRHCRTRGFLRCRTGNKRTWKATFWLLMNKQPTVTCLDSCVHVWKTCELKGMFLQMPCRILSLPGVALLFGLLQHSKWQVAFSVTGGLTWQKCNIKKFYSYSSLHLQLPFGTYHQAQQKEFVLGYSFNHFSFTKAAIMGLLKTFLSFSSLFLCEYTFLQKQMPFIPKESTLFPVLGTAQLYFTKSSNRTFNKRQGEGKRDISWHIESMLTNSFKHQKASFFLQFM